LDSVTSDEKVEVVELEGEFLSLSDFVGKDDVDALGVP
jgi:hypothetical protein